MIEGTCGELSATEDPIVSHSYACIPAPYHTLTTSMSDK